MARVNKELLGFVDEVTEMFVDDYTNNVLHNGEYVAIRGGVNEKDLTIFKITNKVTFEGQFEGQQMTRIEIEESNRRYDVERKYNQLIEYLEKNHESTLKEFEKNNVDEVGHLF